MYLQFFGLVISTYAFVSGMQLSSNFLFNKIMYLRTNKYINNSSNLNSTNGKHKENTVLVVWIR